MEAPLKYLRVLLTLMTGCPEYRYWEKDNPLLKLKQEMLPSWVAVLNGLEALHEDYEKHYPELFKAEEQDERAEQDSMADPHSEGSTGPDEIEGSNE